MINAVQINPEASETGISLSGNAKTTVNAGESLFSILLNSLNVSTESENNPLNASLFSGEGLANMIAAGNNASSLTTTNKTVKKTEQGSLQASDLLLPQSAMPNLISFLEKKGFSSEQIDGIILSSRNSNGLIQINKLVTAMQAVRNGTLSAQCGLSVQASSVPNVQELLFNMGMGVGEVKQTVDLASDGKGGISLDKLADALKQEGQGGVSKTELVSLLEQNNINVTSQTGNMAAAAVGLNNDDVNTQVSAAGISGLKNATISEFEHKNRFTLNAGDSYLTAPSSALKDNADITQAADVEEAAATLKKEFMDFVGVSSQGQEKTGINKTADQLKGKVVVKAQEIKSLENALASDNTASDPSNTIAQEAAEGAGVLNRTLSNGQAKWQKGDQAKVLDILNGEKTGNADNARTAARGIFQDQVEKVQEPADLLKQADQNGKQDILAGVSETKAVSKAQTAESVEIKEGLFSIKDAQGIGVISQNMNKVSGDVEAKTHTKGVYSMPEPLPKVFDRMVVMIKNGEQTGKIIIQPPELGKIDIDLSIKNGHIQANLSTENYAVKEIIETNLNQLKQNLNDQGLIVEQFNVSVGSQNRQFRDDAGQGWGNGNGSTDAEVSGVEDIAAVTDEGTSSIIAGNRNRIDVRV